MVDCSSRRTLGQVKVLSHDRYDVQFEWTIPCVSDLSLGHHYSPAIHFLNRNWYLTIYKKGPDLDLDPLRCVYLNREPTPLAGTTEFVRLTVHFHRRSDEKLEEAPDQNREWWRLGILDIRRIFENKRTVTLACTLEAHRPCVKSVPPQTRTDVTSCSTRKDEQVNTDSKGVPPQIGTDSVSCSTRKDEHLNPGSKGFFRETQTDEAPSRNDATRSEDMEKLREKFRLWLQQPQEGDCIRILREEHFLVEKSEKCSEDDEDGPTSPDEDLK